VKLTIYKKIMLGFGIIIALTIAASSYVLIELQHVAATTRAALTVDVRAIDLAKQMRTITYEEERYAQKYLITLDSAYFAVFVDDNRLFTRFLDSLSSMLPGREEQQYLLTVGELHNWHFTSVAAAGKANLAADERQRTAVIDKILKTLDELIAAKEHAVNASLRDIDLTAQRSLRVASLISLGSLLAAIAAAFLIARTITRPLRTLVEGTRRIAGGAFARIRVRSSDETGDLAAAFNSMSASLDAANRFRAEMMQHISHELRMPLQTMHSAYYLLTEHQTESLNEEQRKLLDSMRDNIDKIARFSNQFLDLSRVEAGMMEYHYAPCSLAELARNAVTDAHVMATRREISLTFSEIPSPPIWVDPERCAEIIANLLSNALKYTDKRGSVEVTVGPCRHGARLEVHDTGIGIPAEELPMVFTKFYRASTAEQGRKRGTGIGLAFVKALVEGQGGHVSVHSTLGRGSTFRVEFPAAKENGEDGGA
jgi:signal transduction histidine kinase